MDDETKLRITELARTAHRAHVEFDLIKNETRSVVPATREADAIKFALAQAEQIKADSALHKAIESYSYL